MCDVTGELGGNAGEGDRSVRIDLNLVNMGDSLSWWGGDMRGKEEKLLVFSPQCNLRPPPHRPWYSQPFWVWKVWTMTASWKMHSVLVQGLTCMSQPVHKSWNLPIFHFNPGALSLWPSDNTLLKSKPRAVLPIRWGWEICRRETLTFPFISSWEIIVLPSLEITTGPCWSQNVCEPAAVPMPRWLPTQLLPAWRAAAMINTYRKQLLPF